MTKEERSEVLEAYEDLRVTDVRDGMDTILRHHSGSMSLSIRPLFRTRAYGIARTCRYVPFKGVIPELSPDEYWEWSSGYYRDVCPYPWVEDIEQSDFIVIDQSGVDVGLMGSANTLNCLKRGARGFVTNGGVRDTDEIIHQKVPFWSLMISLHLLHSLGMHERCDLDAPAPGFCEPVDQLDFLVRGDVLRPPAKYSAGSRRNPGFATTP